jgi:hypothetical protein
MEPRNQLPKETTIKIKIKKHATELQSFFTNALMQIRNIQEQLCQALLPSVKVCHY